MTWDAIVITLNTKYHILKGQGVWTSQDISKKKDDELSGLHAAINNLTSPVGGASGGGGHRVIREPPRLYGCNKLGHLS